MTEQIQEQLHRYISYLEQDKSNTNLLLSVSLCYQRLGRWELAQDYLDKAKKISGNKLYKEQGLLHLANHQLLMARDAFAMLLDEAKTPEHLYLLATSYFLNHKFLDAIKILETENSPLDDDSQLLKAKALHHLHQPADAMVILEALTSKPEVTAEMFGLLALLYFDDSNNEKARSCCTKALALDPENFEGQLVQLLVKTLDNDVTIPEIETLLATHPKEGRLWFALGTTHMRQMQVNKAEAAYLKVTELWPEFYLNWISISWCYLLENLLDKASNAYEKAVAIDANKSDGWGGLALVNVLQNQPEKALPLLEKALAIEPKCQLAALAKMILANHDNPEEALKQFNTLFPEAEENISELIKQTIFSTRPAGDTVH